MWLNYKENMMPSENSQTQKANYLLYDSFSRKFPELVNLYGQEARFMVAWGLGEEKGDVEVGRGRGQWE